MNPHNPSHRKDCGCSFCSDLAKKVQTQEVWDVLHVNHGPKTLKPFTYEDGDVVRTHHSMTWLCCPCGAQLLTLGEK